MSKASDNTKAWMKKQIRRIHSIYSHVRPWPFSFLRHSSQSLLEKVTASIQVAIYWSVDWVTSEKPAIV